MKKNIQNYGNYGNYGISDIYLYSPDNYISLESVLAEILLRNPDKKDIFCAACKKIGHIGMRISHPWEDVITMAAQAIYGLLGRHSTITQLRGLIFASESSVESAKSMGNMVLGALMKAGIDMSGTLMTVGMQNACAAGSIGLINELALMKVQNRITHSVVLCSDIARYTPNTSAEFTQGAGSCSLLLSQDPALVSVDICNIGMYSYDAYDFYRPVHCIYPHVDGKYSMDLYVRMAKLAFEDYSMQCNMNYDEALLSHDAFVFHVPFANMARIALQSLCRQYCNMKKSEIDIYIAQSLFMESMNLHTHIGNLYTSSIFVHLMGTLYNMAQVYGKRMVHKRILCFSYGSGSSILVYSMRVCHNAYDIVQQKQWYPHHYVQVKESDMDDECIRYRKWMNIEIEQKQPFLWEHDGTGLVQKHFYLKRIAANGRREYQFHDIQ